jgi:inositol oxygenase
MALTHGCVCRWGSEPAWAVTAESYPLGCRFSESISGYFFLHACPDRRCSAYATPTGIYGAHCGLDATHFTWSGPEYLSLVLVANGVRLPFAATFLLRYQNFDSTINDTAYSHLFSPDDARCLPLLRKFAAIRRAAATGAGPPSACSRAELVAMCEHAVRKYFPQPHLRF